MVSLKTAYGAGEAWLVNISTEGCAFEKTTVDLNLNEKVLVSLQLGDDGSVFFEASGLVIRQQEGCFGVQFALVEPESQVDLRNYFSKQLRKK
jgi:hypothetical protein